MERVHAAKCALASGQLLHASVSRMNQVAVAYQRQGDHLNAAAALTMLLETVACNKLTHAELHVCWGN
ncbi:hypothetical protein HaLaN_05358, partial [Haematococcus lacustris]